MADAWLRRTICIVVMFLLLLAIWQLAYVLLLAFAGLLFAVLLRHCVLIITRHTPAGEGVALGLVILAFLLVFGGGSVLFGRRMMDEGRQLLSLLPQSIAVVQQALADQPWGKFVIDNAPSVAPVKSWNILGTIGGTLSVVIGTVTNVVVFLFVGLFLASNPRLYRRGLLHLVPLHRRERAREVLDALGHGLWMWLKGQFIDMTIVAILTGVGLWILGVPLPVALGVIAGVTNIIPYVGPFIAGVPAVLIAFTLGFDSAVYTTILFVVVAQFDGHIIMPVIQKQSTSLPPVLTILAVIGFGVLFGFIGIVVATPLLLVLLILVRMLYVEDILGDHSLAKPGAGAGTDPPESEVSRA